MINKDDISFDPSNSEILGVFKDVVHIKYEHFNIEGENEIEYAILLVPKKEYLRVWDNWLKGKQEYCERYDHYCGVLGYTEPLEIIELDGKNQINIWNDNLRVYEELFVQAFKIDKFSDNHDFEHG